MSSLIGYYSLIFGVGVSILVIFFSIKNFNDTQKLDTKVISLVFLQLLFVIISFSGLILSFVNSDFSNETVFEEGKGVVAEGFLKDENFFSATKILAKHDENYMPPEVKAALEEK